MGLILAFIGLMMSLPLERACLQLTNQVRIPPRIADDLISVLLFTLSLFLWTLFTTAAVCIALKKPMRKSVAWAVTTAFLASTPFVWAFSPAFSRVSSHVVAVAIGVVLLFGVALSLAAGKRGILPVANAAALVLIAVPSLMAWAALPQQPPSARQVWSSVLQQGSWQPMNTGDEFGATRHAVFAGDRVVAIFDTGTVDYEGDKPMSKYRLVSIDRRTGALKNSTEFVGRWGGTPYIFATNDGHVILSGHVLTRLNPDLSASGIESVGDCSLAHNISTDGAVMACETTPGITVVATSSLKPTGIRLSESTPVAISSNAALTTNSSWNVEYPNDKAFITLTDEHGPRPIYHGECGGSPRFLNDDRVLVLDCGAVRVIDLSGKTVAAHTIEPGGKFAGISQDGKRFALQYSAEKGDFPIVLYERFVIYDSQLLSPVAIADSKYLPERQSWSALSSDGKYFLSGNPDGLTLYQLP